MTGRRLCRRTPGICRLEAAGLLKPLRHFRKSESRWYRCLTNFTHLNTAYKVPYQLDYLAWGARNLLELSIWAKYVTVSKENARKLHNDQITDASEVQKGMSNLVREYEPTHPESEELQQQGDVLSEIKAEIGLKEESRHLNIGTIAKEVGVSTLFSNSNGLLSKLVHPTAFSILLDLDQSREAQLRRGLFGLGLGATEDTLKDLIAYFNSVGIDTSLLGA
jgi:uncharacterized protein DUF5677